jgi:hypothetical protein
MNQQLAVRNFGDCEIHAISFLNGSAYFNIFDPRETTFFTLVFHSVGILVFATDHAQNVIETIRFFEDFDALKRDPTAREFFRKVESLNSNLDRSRKFAYIMPITGGKTLISFSSVAMEE